LTISFSVSEKTLKAKWKGLRDNYRVEFKRIPRDEVTGEMLVPPEEFDSKWAHYKPLCFLAEHLRSRTDKNDFDCASLFMKNEGNSNDFEVDLSAALPQPPPAHQPQPTQKSLKEILEEKPLLSNFQLAQLTGTGNHNNNSVPRVKAKASPTPQIQAVKRPRVESADEEYSPPQPSSPANNKDDDYHFLMSLHPYMVDLNAPQKLRVRMKIQKLIFKELFKDEDDAEEGK
jgi:BESS motif/Alcohol dehydrogenase transcription factor Myb/SANT-like